MTLHSIWRIHMVESSDARATTKRKRMVKALAACQTKALEEQSQVLQAWIASQRLAVWQCMHSHPFKLCSAFKLCFNFFYHGSVVISRFSSDALCRLCRTSISFNESSISINQIQSALWKHLFTSFFTHLFTLCWPCVDMALLRLHLVFAASVASASSSPQLRRPGTVHQSRVSFGLGTHLEHPGTLQKDAAKASNIIKQEQD